LAGGTTLNLVSSAGQAFDLGSGQISLGGVGGNVTLGPILLGVSRPVHILTPSATVRTGVPVGAA
jgi:phosphotransacetylase